MCGIFGVIRKKRGCHVSDKMFKQLVRSLGIASSARGTDATGIGYINNAGNAVSVKYSTPAWRFPFYRNIPSETRAVLGHTRMTTKGSEKRVFNNHPFVGKLKNEKFLLAHNGTICNDDILRRTRKLGDTKIETDSYIAVQLIESEGNLTHKALKEVAEELWGSFTLTILDSNNNFNFVKETNPLTILDYKELGLIIYASTADIIIEALKDNKLLYSYTAALLEASSLDKLEVIEPKEGSIVTYNYDADMWINSEFDFLPSNTANWYSYYRDDTIYGEDDTKYYYLNNHYNNTKNTGKSKKDVDKGRKENEKDRKKHREDLATWYLKSQTTGERVKVKTDHKVINRVVHKSYTVIPKDTFEVYSEEETEESCFVFIGDKDFYEWAKVFHDEGLIEAAIYYDHCYKLSGT